MKLLLDTCVWGLAAARLRSEGHDVVWAGEWPEDPGDEEIRELAYLEGRILVTLDNDCGELAVVYCHPHTGIIRLVDFESIDQAVVCFRILNTHAKQLQRGAISTAEPGRFRIRDTEFTGT
jgi:predicted nuclease of predicted toxin-antitoxin system